jgi:hypothetical protein
LDGFLNHIKTFVITAMILLQGHSAFAQQTIAFDISTQNDNKRVFLFNTRQQVDSVHLKNKAGKNLPADNVFPADYPHKYAPEIILFEADGSVLYIDTGGNFYMRDVENFEAKPISLKINIDTLGLGKKNLMIECSNRDLENLEVFVVPFDKYRVASTTPQVTTKINFRLEEIIYGAKGKTPPRLLDLWKEQIQFNPADRKILYDYQLILPFDMVKRGKVTLIVYDLSYQVVAIYPDMTKTVNTITRDNIISATYVYKIFMNGKEEVKKGLIHYLSPEDEQKKQELLNPPPAETDDAVGNPE